MTKVAPGARALLVDVTRCTGCEACVQACVEANALDSEAADRDRAVTADGLSANRLCTVRRLERGRWARVSCMHCLEPSCVAACLVGGLRRTPEGAVVYDADRCIGCRYCMLACPMHVPRYQWDARLPFMKKCSLCHDRLVAGQLPACVDACPHEALSFGPRTAMLELAHDRIAGQPRRYLPHVWGEHEWGGTSVLYVADVDLAPLGLVRGARRSVPSITEPVIRTTPRLALSVALTMSGLMWVVDRRRRLMGGAEDDDGENTGA
ncbi:MAG: 4Fe-4S dicluster domain-containing protein [Acidobacteria bacterium]|jgi:formate dehydrogenase iron-sulfur subunit|nr:4Fe-4S dicluster domain-containing protein [Acidobacteriota bacterium]